MTTIGGNNITITASDLAGATGTYIVRTPTADSNDTLDTATNMILEYFGENTTNFNQSTWEITIYNDSNFTITLNSDSGTTLFPTDPDTILPQTTKVYIFVQTAPSTVEIYQQSNGNSVAVSGIQLNDGNILVGSSDNIGTGVSMSGEAVIDNTGELTLTSSLLYDAIVDPAGGGDYTTLSAAITGGAISVYLKNGTISETTSITLPDGVRLVGESKNSIIDFGTNNAGLILSSGGPGVIDTINITSGTNAVTGTAFTSGMVGEYIILEETFYEISTVTPPNSLTIIKNYNGKTLTAEGSVILPLVTGSFYNFMIQGSGTGGTVDQLTLGGTINVIVKDVCFMNSRRDAINGAPGGVIANTQLLIESCTIDSPSRHGIIGTTVVQSNILQCIIKNPVLNGINLDISRNVIINGINITNCGSDGITVSNILTNEIIISDTISDNGSGNGINIDSSAVSVVIQACSCTNNSLAGIVLGSTNNTIGGCTIDLNADNGITFLSTSTDNTVNNCQITGNGNYGIDITNVSAVNNSITSNIISGNTTGQVNNPGTASANTLFSGNMVAGIKDNAIFFAHDNTGGLSITTAAQTLPFDTSSTVNDTGYSLNTGEITITATGIYEISYWVQCESLNNIGSARTELTGQLEVNTVLVPGSASSAYIREQGTGVVGYGCGKTMPISLTANDVVRVRFFKGIQTTTAQTKAAESSIYIKRLGL